MVEELYGPRTAFGRTIHAMKYRTPEETFDDYCVRYARITADDPEHFRRLLRALRDQVFLPAGRQQLSVGRPHQTTAFNCFVGSRIPDDTAGIFEEVKRGALTMRAGGGVGWDFSTIRPSGEPIRGLGYGAIASGPVSFMNVWNEMCGTIMSAGERRGAMMGILRIDHPDVLAFINAKRNLGRLTNFNISVTVTDEFMAALACDGTYKLRFGDLTFGDVRAADVWATIMESNWDFAEPGVIFIDRVNEMNPLYYCETIAASNPCSEQMLPNNGCCLLASINVVKLLTPIHSGTSLGLAATGGKVQRRYEIDQGMLRSVVSDMVRACDNVIDRTVYPLPEQREEERQKRRMGLGVTGMANALEVMGLPYGSTEYLAQQDEILHLVNEAAYLASSELAARKGSFPLFDQERYCSGQFFGKLSEEVRESVQRKGLRNGLLTSIAPTGTISLAADNVSSGIEPVFAHRGKRLIYTPEGQREFDVIDYAVGTYGVEGRTADQVTAEEHIDVLCRAQQYVDNAISKTCNVNGQVGGAGPGVPYSDFVKLYLRAWEGGAKSCATFNINGKRAGIMRPVEKEEPKEGLACAYDPATGARSCE
jgi:ribonucleoside-diphosphate reductase alpha chain